MVSTSKLNLHQPIGTLLADHNLTPSTTTQFHCTNAQAANLFIGQRVRIYAKPFTDNHRTLISVGNVTNTATITNLEANTPTAGETRVTFTPACSQPPDFADQMFDPEVVNVTTALANQMQTIDDRMDAILCTPSTRPSSPFTGQIIVESAVFGAPPFEVRRWNGSIWELIVSAGGGGGTEVTGRIAYVVSNAASGSVGNGAESGVYISATFSAIINHTYLIEFSGTLQASSGATPTPGAQVTYRVATGASVSTADTLIGTTSAEVDIEALPITITGTIHYTADATDQKTIGAFLRCYFSGGPTVSFIANSHSYLAIEDGGII